MKKTCCQKCKHAQITSHFITLEEKDIEGKSQIARTKCGYWKNYKDIVCDIPGTEEQQWKENKGFYMCLKPEKCDLYEPEKKEETPITHCEKCKNELDNVERTIEIKQTFPNGNWAKHKEQICKKCFDKLELVLQTQWK